MRGMRVALVLMVSGMLSGVAAAADTRGPDSLPLARELYSAAEYEVALGMLERLRASTAAGGEIASIEQYRAFCLYALGRASDAEQAIAAAVVADPTSTPGDAGLSPRLRAAYRDVRVRTLPAVIKQRYDNAKAAFDRREFAAAAVGFAGVLRMIGDPDLADQAGASPLSDVRKLAEGFRDLSTAAAAPPPPAPAPAPAIATAAKPESPLPAVFTSDHREVTPPAAITQTLPPFPPELTAANPGVIEVVIDERGLVQSALMRVSINPRYDRLVIDTARTWKYEPARRNGVPVKFRKMVQIVVKRDR